MRGGGGGADAATDADDDSGDTLNARLLCCRHGVWGCVGRGAKVAVLQEQKERGTQGGRGVVNGKEGGGGEVVLKGTKSPVVLLGKGRRVEGWVGSTKGEDCVLQGDRMRVDV
eukprot:162704-Chlamydomonas_euryale.AAC.1